MQKIFYNSSLPRSGSTLLQNILAQNPDFYCSPTSGVSELMLACIQQFNNSQTFKAQDHNKMSPHLLSFVNGGLWTYYSSLTDKKYIVDKSRAWVGKMRLLKKLDPDAKVVSMIRDPRAIFASLEKKQRQNPERENYVTNHAQLKGTTMSKRINEWAVTAPIGPALESLKNLIQTNYISNILFIKYEDLVLNPEVEIKKIYDYFEIPFYENHDFVNITQHTHEFDSIHGIYGDHALRSELKALPDDYLEVLGEHICNELVSSFKWFYEHFNYSS